MPIVRFASASRLAVGVSLLTVLAASALPASADIKIGIICDQTGPFAAGGSKAASIGNKIASDMINEKGGVEGHRIIPVEAEPEIRFPL
jgi:branched-chain amino acid transport system substrate-binding protein